MARYQFERGRHGPGLEHLGHEPAHFVAVGREPAGIEHGPESVTRSVLAEQGPFGHGALGPEDLDVRRPSALVFVTTPVLSPATATGTTATERRREGAGMGYRHRRERPDAIGMATGHDPSHHRTPVVSHEVETVEAEVIGDGEDIGHELRDAVVLDGARPGTRRVAALVEGDAAISRALQGVELVVPGVPGLGKAVEQDHGSAVIGPGVQCVEPESARGDLDRLQRSWDQEAGVGSETIDRHCDSRLRTPAGVIRRVSSETAPAMARCWW